LREERKKEKVVVVDMSESTYWARIESPYVRSLVVGASCIVLFLVLGTLANIPYDH
jgi:solute carrier family 25 S-adenosylmethionine transporter 26